VAFGLVWLEKFVINGELIKEGLGWVYMRYCKLPLCVEWQRLQLAAQNDKRGLWRDSDHVPPWEFRRHRKEYAAPVVSLNTN
jgi:endonuclease YncB( thermonuclease family)